MAAIAASTALTEMRALLRDTDTSAPAFTDAEGIEMLNIGTLWWHENMERRTVRYTRAAPIRFTGAVTTWTAGVAYLETEISSGDMVVEFLELGLDGFAAVGLGGTTIPLDRMDWGELRQRQYVNYLTSGQPTHFSVLKLSDSFEWRIALYPIANNESTGPDVGWTLVGVVRIEPTLLVNATDLIDAGDSETRSIILLAAILMAPLMNRRELAAHFRTLLPERVSEKMETTSVHDEVNA